MSQSQENVDQDVDEIQNHEYTPSRVSVPQEGE